MERDLTLLARLFLELPNRNPFSGVHKFKAKEPRLEERLFRNFVEWRVWGCAWFLMLRLQSTSLILRHYYGHFLALQKTQLQELWNLAIIGGFTQNLGSVFPKSMVTLDVILLLSYNAILTLISCNKGQIPM